MMCVMMNSAVVMMVRRGDGAGLLFLGRDAVERSWYTMSSSEWMYFARTTRRWTCSLPDSPSSNPPREMVSSRRTVLPFARLSWQEGGEKGDYVAVYRIGVSMPHSSERGRVPEE
jgi:hypothetical protein